MKLEEYNGYRVGAAKRKFKMGRKDFEPGTLINKFKAQKVAQSKAPMPVDEKLTVMGAI